MNPERIKTKRLSDNCTKIGSGFTPRGGDSVYQSEGTSLIRSQNVYNGYFTRSGLAHISDEIAEEMSGVTIESGDILLNITGDSVARCCIVPEEILPARVNQHVAIIRSISESINKKYLMYFLISPYMQTYMLSIAGSGGTRKALTKIMIEDFNIPTPKIEVQQKIASILSAYDDLIENNLRRIELLEQSARHLYEEWFVRFRFPGYEHTKMKNEIPEGWEKKELIDIVNLTMGQSPASSFYNDSGEGLPFHQGVTNYGTRYVDNKQFCTFLEGRIALENDILFSVRAPVGRINITLDKIIIGRGLCSMRSRNGNQSFLFYQLKNAFFKEDMIGSGSIYASVTKDQLQKYELLQPCNKNISLFEEIVKPIDDQLSILIRQNQKLKQARDLLLPKLMNGDIAV